MKLVSAGLMRAALLLGSSIAIAPPVIAQDAGRTYSLTKEERAGLAPLAAANRSGSPSAAMAALPGAKAAASSTDARYLVASEELRLGIQSGNRQLQAEAIDAMLASGLVAAADLPELLRNQAGLAITAGNQKKAEGALARLLELQPEDVPALEALARVRTEQRNYPAAVGLVERMIDRRLAANQPVSEGSYKYALNYALMSKMNVQALKFAHGLIAAYPTSENWRDVLLIYRDLAKPDPAGELDLMRLMRLNKSLAGERDYLSFAEKLNAAGLPGEAKSVLDEGVAANMIDAAKAPAVTLRKTASAKAATETKAMPAKEKAALAAAAGTSALNVADSHFGRAEYAKAVPLYRAALEKGSVDAGLVNTRLGIALAMSGQKAEAETAFRAVSGLRAGLGDLLLVWLTQQRA